MRIAVVAALPEELIPLARRLTGKLPPRVGGRHDHETANGTITLMATGAGAVLARCAIHRLLAEVEPHALFGVGCAGGLTPDLEVGDLLVGEKVLDEASGATLDAVDSRWLRRAIALPRTAAGTVVSSRRIANDPEAKSRLARCASFGPAVVDLEGWSWWSEAAAAGVPFVLLRGVTDRWNETLPLDFERLRGPAGDIDRGRVLRAAASRPRAWTRLFALRRRLRRVASRLADSVVEVLGP